MGLVLSERLRQIGRFESGSVGTAHEYILANLAAQLGVQRLLKAGPADDVSRLELAVRLRHFLAADLIDVSDRMDGRSADRIIPDHSGTEREAPHLVQVSLHHGLLVQKRAPADRTDHPAADRVETQWFQIVRTSRSDQISFYRNPLKTPESLLSLGYLLQSVGSLGRVQYAKVHQLFDRRLRILDVLRNHHQIGDFDIGCQKDSVPVIDAAPGRDDSLGLDMTDRCQALVKFPADYLKVEKTDDQRREQYRHQDHGPAEMCSVFDQSVLKSYHSALLDADSPGKTRSVKRSDPLNRAFDGPARPQGRKA